MKSVLYSILAFLFCSLVLHAKTVRLAPEAESLALVHGCVSIVNGDFVEQKTDLFIDAPSPIALTRIFDSGQSQVQSTLGQGFTWSFARMLDLYGSWRVAGLEEREGLSLYYHCTATKNGLHYSIHPSAFAVGYTNYSPIEISGANSLHNVTLHCRNYQALNRRNEEGLGWVEVRGGEFVVTLGCGTQRLYKYIEQGGGVRYWILDKELRPDGNRILYQYDVHCNINKATVTDSTESVPLICYYMKYNGHKITALGSNGQQVHYTVNTFRQNLRRSGGWYKDRLATVEGDHLIRTEYAYFKNLKSAANIGQVERIHWPNGRVLGIDYDLNGRVVALKAPIGNGAEPYPLASFIYGKQTRDWIGAEGQRTHYLLDHNNRVASVEKYHAEKPYSKTCYWWGTEGKLAGSLTGVGFYDAAGKLHSSEQFTYDEKGNIIRKVVGGNLTGQYDQEGYATEYIYLPIFNKIQEEKGGDGSYTEYRYKEGTNLLTAKIQGQPQPFLREFFEYDPFANQTKHIVDDGSGTESHDLTDVSVRTIIETLPITVPLSPAFGKPRTRHEKYWEAGKEHILRTIHYHYNPNGYPFQEDHHDAEGNYRYSIHRCYDAAGRVLEETNPIGQKTIHTYDLNGNRIYTIFVDQEIQVEYLYDLSNRLIKETQIHPHASYETTHRYDRSSRKTATVDPFGNQTLYTYDDLDRVISITHPTGGLEQFDYDIQGNKTAIHNVLGGVTRASYTARGQPIQVTHPDGSQEAYLYNANGLLARQTAANGVETTIYYDTYLRPTLKQICGADLSYTTQADYKGNLVTREVDAKGIETHYRYDGAGRLIETTKGIQRTTLSYDSLGRKHRSLEWIDSTSVQATIWEYDDLNRILEERVEDYSVITHHSSLITSRKFAYDRWGNCRLQTTGTSQGLAQIRTEYDSCHRPILQIDALGNRTYTEYDENLTQGILRTIVTDPLGNQTITTQNSIGQVTEQIRQDPLGTLTARSSYSYDLAGQKIQQIDTAIAPSLPSRTIITEWIYDSMGRVIALTEAKDTPEQKCTSYAFNERGQKETIYLPDGTELRHAYDGLGRLQRYFASDQSFAYSYEYDLNHNAHKVIDELTRLATLREYDQNNRIIHETLANGLALSYTYDSLNRPIKVVLPDQTYVEYTYNACHLKTVSRPERSYEHQYTSYDLSGTLLEELSPIGKIHYSWDLLNRPRCIQSSYFTETIPEEGYDAIGNLLNKIRKDPDRLTHCRYSYDTLYQLKSETVTGFDAHEYTYDSLYNRRLRDNKEHTVNHLNQLLSLEETSYAYDKRGNLIAETTPTTHTEYRYDALGRLTSLSRDGINYTYQYDAFNRRLQKTSDQTTERYIYTGQNEIGLVNEQGKITQLRILGSGKAAEIGSAIALELDDNIYIPLYDHCGHVSVLVDLATKQFAEAYVYSAFGEEQRYGPGTTNPWHFSSKRYDPESGWIYFGRRYYDPATGRWTTPDPIGFADGPNLYAYVKNSPLTHFDAYGLWEFGPNPLLDLPVSRQFASRSSGRWRSGDRNSRSSTRISERRGLRPNAKEFAERYGYVGSKDIVILDCCGRNTRCGVVYSHGINTGREDVIAEAKDQQAMWDGSLTVCLVRRTKGIPVDGRRIASVMIKGDNSKKYVERTAALIRNMNEYMKEKGGYTVISGFSGGTVINQQALKSQSEPDRTNYMIVVNCGGVLSDRENFLHGVSMHEVDDFVPILVNRNAKYLEMMKHPEWYGIDFFKGSELRGHSYEVYRERSIEFAETTLNRFSSLQVQDE